MNRPLVGELDAGTDIEVLAHFTANRLKHPFTDETVKLYDAVAFLARLLYPKLGPKAARDRVRKAFRYHQIKEALPRGDVLPTVAVVKWMHGQWPKLRVIAPTLPHTLKATANSVPALRGELSIRSITRDPQALRELYFAAEDERERLADENAALQARLAAAEGELAIKKAKKAQHSKVMRESGRKGGRGKSL